MSIIYHQRAKVIKNPKGSITKLIDKNDKNFRGFGEIYISECKFGEVKAWKKHKKMTSNLFLISGKIRVVICKNYKDSDLEFGEYYLTNKNFNQITIPPKIWFGFQGLSKNKNSVINISNLIHDDIEVENLPLKKIKFNWKKYI